MNRLNEMLEYWRDWNKERRMPEDAGDGAAREIAQLATAEIQSLQSKLDAEETAHAQTCANIESLAAAWEDERKALTLRLDKAEKRIALNDDYATSRLCPDHRGKWMRGRCVLCELEAAESRLDAALSVARRAVNVAQEFETVLYDAAPDQHGDLARLLGNVETDFDKLDGGRVVEKGGL